MLDECVLVVECCVLLLECCVLHNTDLMSQEEVGLTFYLQTHEAQLVVHGHGGRHRRAARLHIYALLDCVDVGSHMHCPPQELKWEAED